MTENEEQVMVCVDNTLAHHWDIEPSKGTISIGTCRKCNQVKKFTNSIGNVASWRERGAEFKRREVVRESKAGKDKDNG